MVFGRFSGRYGQVFDFTDGEELQRHRLLGQRVDEPRSQHENLVYFFFQEEITGKASERSRLIKSGSVMIRKVCNQLPACYGDELRSLFTGGDEDCSLRIEVRSKPKQVTVECAA